MKVLVSNPMEQQLSGRALLLSVCKARQGLSGRWHAGQVGLSIASSDKACPAKCLLPVQKLEAPNNVERVHLKFSSRDIFSNGSTTPGVIIVVRQSFQTFSVMVTNDFA